MKSARIIMTEHCTRQCDYCCNRLPDVRIAFQFVPDLAAIPLENYREICISGGEPLLYPQSVDKVIQWAGNRKIYLYTNGDLILSRRSWLTRWKESLSGLNISLHDGHTSLALEQIQKSLGIPLRVHVQDCKVTNSIIYATEPPNLSLKIWVAGQCVVKDEDRYILTKLP